MDRLLQKKKLFSLNPRTLSCRTIYLVLTFYHNCETIKLEITQTRTGLSLFFFAHEDNFKLTRLNKPLVLEQMARYQQGVSTGRARQEGVSMLPGFEPSTLHFVRVYPFDS